MDEAFAACCFLLLEGAFVEAHERVFPKLGTFGAHSAVCFVVVSAVDFHHVSDGSLLTFHSFMFGVGWLWLHVNLLLTKCLHPHKD